MSDEILGTDTTAEMNRCAWIVRVPIGSERSSRHVECGLYLTKLYVWKAYGKQSFIVFDVGEVEKMELKRRGLKEGERGRKRLEEIGERRKRRRFKLRQERSRAQKCLVRAEFTEQQLGLARQVQPSFQP